MAMTHVLPVYDDKKHIKHPECWCEPVVKWPDVLNQGLVVHRDATERATGVPADGDPARGPWVVEQ